MRIIPTILGILLLIVLIGGVWVLRYRPQWLQPAEAVAEEDDEEVDPQKLEVPVHVGKVTKTTLRQMVDALGTIEPAPARPGQMAGTADVAAPVAGIVSEILVEAGSKVTAGTPLIQLDDRVAKIAELQAAAAVEEASATLAQLKAAPRQEQVQIAQLAVDKARTALEFAERGYGRQQNLAQGGGAATKSVEQSALELAAAKNDLAVAEKQLALIIAPPMPEVVAAQKAKAAQAEAALASAAVQRQMLRIVSPIDGTIIAINANPGDSVDTTKVLADIVALDRLVIHVELPIAAATELKAGQPAQIVVDPASGKSSTSTSTTSPPDQGTITFVGSEVDRKTGTVPVMVSIPAGSNFKPGQTVRVGLVSAEHKDCLAVNKESVATDDNGDPFVAVVDGDQAVHKGVHLGLRQDDLIEVESDALKDGDTVVTAGVYGLAKLQVAKVKVLDK